MACAGGGDQRIHHRLWRTALNQTGTQRLVSLPVAAAGVNHLTSHQVDHRNQFRHKKPYMNQCIFVFEFITGGGLAGEPLPPSLAREGVLMRDTLLRDALELPATTVLTLHDIRLDPALPGSIAVADAASFDAAFDHALALADAVLVVAPETGGVLAALTGRVEAASRLLLGCDSASSALAASKSRTARALAKAGIAALPHYTDADTLPDILGAWAVKPDDGAGCDGLQRLPDRATAAAALRCAPGRRVAQPWLEGEACSMNLLCVRGHAALLSVNRQILADDDGRITLAALAVGDIPPTPAHGRLAQQIAAALPGLLGPVGVDFVETDDGPVVVEINPRMSTSACALRAATGVNLVAATLAAVREGRLPVQTRTRPQHIALADASETA